MFHIQLDQHPASYGREQMQTLVFLELTLTSESFCLYLFFLFLQRIT